MGARCEVGITGNMCAMTESHPQPPYQQHPAPGASPAYAPQYEPPKKKRGRGCLWFILGAIAVIAAIIIGAVALLGSAADKVDKDSKAKHTVEYKVTGAGKADLTFTTDTNASISQENGATLPWTKKLDVTGFTGGMNIQAQNGMDGGSGKISCEVIVDGKSVKTASSSGQGAIASCSAP